MAHFALRTLASPHGSEPRGRTPHGSEPRGRTPHGSEPQGRTAHERAWTWASVAHAAWQ
ncbi:hypothetical protein HanIR_Chr07g0338471 [Helianthus annuus]|nr:hypothetical protein HanIR_Chr07g0338471 [Helianthus annuus]